MSARIWEELADYERARQESDDPLQFPRIAYGLVLICPLCGKVSAPVEQGTAWEAWEGHRARHTAQAGER